MVLSGLCCFADPDATVFLVCEEVLFVFLQVIVQFQPSAMPDEWGTTQDGQTRPRVVKRGIDDDHDEVPDGELPQVDHLVFMVHGIGPVCDLRFRSMVECGMCDFSI